MGLTNQMFVHVVINGKKQHMDLFGDMKVRYSNMILTNEQSEQVSNNHSLIYWIGNLKRLDLSDWYDLLAIELCYTIKYDPKASNYKRVDNLVKKEYAKTKLQKNNSGRIYSLDEISVASTIDDLDMDMDMKDLLDNDATDILRMRAMGYTQTDIAETLGVTQSYISKIIDKKRKRVLWQ